MLRSLMSLPKSFAKTIPGTDNLNADGVTMAMS